jgi:hypothetical protein
VRRLLVLTGLILAPLCASAQLSKEERQGIATALYLRNLTPKDLEYVRRSKSTPSPLPAIAEAIDRPLESTDALIRLHRTKGDGLSAYLPTALALLQVPLQSPASDPEVVLPDSVPESLRGPVGRLVVAMAAANGEIGASLATLKPEERRALIDTLPFLAGGAEGKLGFVQNPPVSEALISTLLARVNLKRLLAASLKLAEVVEAEIPNLRATASTPISEPIRFRVGGVPVEITGSGPDLHRETVSGLCIDLGGSDVYAGRYGAGVLASSVLIDLGGNDFYQVGDLSVGAGLLGVGLAYDLGGHDSFRGNSLCLGAGLAGVGALFKDGGDDEYVSRAMSQGFGAYGVGLAVDTRGDDRRRVSTIGEGAGTKGGLGWLDDLGGDDIYAASGPIAEGAGRGGIGLLSDLAGDDGYSGAELCQGAGLEEGLGSLYDEKGRDSHTSDHAAMSFADGGAAYLIDLSGDDIYASRGGACLSTAQGRGVAVLVDREGNDLYASADGRPALATDGGLALFLDTAGTDRYMGVPGGAVRGRRGDSLGLFVDLNGADGYAEGLEDGSARVDAEGGVALDAESTLVGVPTSIVGPAVGSAQDPGAEAIDALVAQGTPESRDRLVAIGMPAFHRLLDRHLREASDELMSTILRLGRLLGESAKPAIAGKLQSPNDEELRRALQLAVATGLTQAAPRIAELVKRPEVQRDAVEAAGVLRVRQAIGDIAPLAGSDNPEMALTAILALERIGDESSLATAQALLGSPEYPVRRAAMRLLSKFSATATATAERLLADPSERNQRLGIELLGMVGTDDALSRAANRLSGGTAGLRIQAMLAVNGRCPVAFRSTLVALRSDPDPNVRAVAARIDPGR